MDVVGIVATCVLAVSLVPQVQKTFETRNADALSWKYILLQLTANALWIVYGIGIHSIPVIASNCMIAACSISLVYAKMNVAHEEKIPLV